MSTVTTKSIDAAMKKMMDGPYGESLKREYGQGDSSRQLALLAWFCSRGVTGAGQWPGDPDDFAKQVKAREEFDAWWNSR